MHSKWMRGTWLLGAARIVAGRIAEGGPIQPKKQHYSGFETALQTVTRFLKGPDKHRPYMGVALEIVNTSSA